MRKSILLLASIVLMVLLASGVAWAVNRIQCERGEDLCRGTSERDQIFGAHSRDTIKAYGDNDYIDALEGNDVVYGGDGRDDIDGAEGEDRLYGGADQDIVVGWEDDDVIYGNDYRDSVDGYLGSDRLYGGGGNDTMYTGARSVWDEEEEQVVARTDQRKDYVDCGAGRDTVWADHRDTVKNCETLMRYVDMTFD
jgi:Ca2+-binding RTX toxin-like protein